MIAGEDSSQLNSIQMDFVARRYDTFSEVFTISYYDSNNILQEVDLTSAVVQMQIKKRKSDAGAILNMDVALSGNEITISKHHTLMSLAKGKYWYDLEVQDSDGNHITWVHGRFTVVEHVTEFVSTYFSNILMKFRALLEISTTTKFGFSTFMQSMLTIFTVTAYVFFGIPKVILKFITINWIVKEYPAFFKIILDIIDVPKTVINSIFSIMVIFLGKIPFFRSAPFSITVFFYDQGEPLDPYAI